MKIIFLRYAVIIAAGLFLSSPSRGQNLVDIGAGQDLMGMLGFNCAIGVELTHGVKMMILARPDKTYMVSYDVPPRESFQKGNQGAGALKAELFVEKAYPYGQDVWRSKDEKAVTNFYDRMAKEFFEGRSFMTETPEYLPAWLIGWENNPLFVRRIDLINAVMKSSPCDSAPAAHN